MRFTWHVSLRTEPRDHDAPRSGIVRWALIGLAVLGLLAVIVWRAWGVLV